MSLSTMLLFFDSIGYEVFCTFISIVWQSSILFLFAYSASWLLRHQSETIKHAIWVSVLLMMPFLPAVTWLINSAGSPVTEIKMLPNYSYTENITVNDQSEIRSITPVTDVADNSDQQVYPSGITVLKEKDIGSQILSAARKHFWGGLFITYLIVAVAFILMTIGAGLRIRSWISYASPVTDTRVIYALERIKDHFGISRNVGILESTDVAVPITFGSLHPVVLLPIGFTDELSDDDIKVLLVHELSHIKRHDPFTLTLLTLIRSVFFFHPLVWFASREASYYAESSCDSFAFRYTGTPHSYAEMLSRSADTIRRRSIITEYAVGIFATKKILLRRIYAILENNGRFKSLSILAKTSIFLGLILSISIAASFPVRGKDGKVSPLFHEFEVAVVKQNVDEVRDILNKNPHLKDLRGRNGGTLFHSVVGDNHIKMTEVLIGKNIPLDKPDDDGNTPLHLAIITKSSETISLLLLHGADPEKKNGEGLRPLETAAEKGFYSIADLLIEHGAEVSIHTASLLGKTEKVKILLQDDPSLANSRNRDGKTALHLLCNREKSGTNNGFALMDMGMTKKFGPESLGAREVAGLEIIGILLENDADPKVRDDNGWMPLHYAAKNGRYEESELLLSAVAPVNAKLEDGDTPLHIAAWNDSEVTARKLVENGAKINAVNEHGATPLVWANIQDNSSLISYLTNIGMKDRTNKLNAIKTWKHFLKSPYSEKALSVHLLAIGRIDITEPIDYGRSEYDSWYIAKALHIKCSNGGDYRCLEICQGTQMARIPGKLIVLDSNGEILKTFTERNYIVSDLLTPNTDEMFRNPEVERMVSNEKWIVLPDCNGDGYGDIPVMTGYDNRAIYSTHADDFPLIFEADISGMLMPREMLTDIETGRTMLQYVEKPSPGLRIVFQPLTQVKTGSNTTRIIMDPNKSLREIARYEWDSVQGKFIGPQNTTDDTWKINFPDMVEK
jgi:ankyrin repeat protein/beta-lactamase regulating signal transducer with metallopeptidase domain